MAIYIYIYIYIYIFNFQLALIVFFLTNAQVHDSDKRLKYNVHVVAHCSTSRAFAIGIQGSSLWNSTDPSIKLASVLTHLEIHLSVISYLCISCSCTITYLVCTLVLCVLCTVHHIKCSSFNQYSNTVSITNEFVKIYYLFHYLTVTALTFYYIYVSSVSINIVLTNIYWGLVTSIARKSFFIVVTSITNLVIAGCS